MSLLGKRWQIYEQKNELCGKIAKEFDISPLTAQVLLNRGVNTSEGIKKFLDPRLSYLSDPMELPDISKAAKRIFLAKERGEKVLVYGDYDVDGVTGTVILLHTLNLIGIKASYYIPHRYNEGYGMNEGAVREIKTKAADLIITVDCGISNANEIDLANSLDMDVIVTDHHNVPKKLPKALALVNPKLQKGDHPSKELSGAGVAFKFAWGLLRLAGVNDSEMLIDMLDLVGLGTIADVVPLVDENRILAVQGLNLLNQRKRIGIKQLSKAAGLYGKIKTRQVNFMLSPRINAAGRLEHARHSVELLLQENEESAKDLAEKLSEINSERQNIGGRIAGEAYEKIEKDNLGDSKLIFISGRDWHPGVIGIVASQIADKFYRPTILVGENDNEARGSARSIDGFDIFKFLEKEGDLYNNFGGHKAAAGFSIDPKKISLLKDRLLKSVEGFVPPYDLTPKVIIDALISPNDITMGFVQELESLSPHGPANPLPVFLTRDVKLTDFRTVGSKDSHLKLKFSLNGTIIDSIGFGLGSLSEKLVSGRNYDIAYSLGTNVWNGFESAELSLVDIQENG